MKSKSFQLIFSVIGFALVIPSASYSQTKQSITELQAKEIAADRAKERIADAIQEILDQEGLTPEDLYNQNTASAGGTLTACRCTCSSGGLTPQRNDKLDIPDSGNCADLDGSSCSMIPEGQPGTFGACEEHTYRLNFIERFIRWIFA